MSAHEVTVTVSQPYHVVGYQGGRYGASQYTKRDYTANVMGKDIKRTSKIEIQRRIRELIRAEELACGFVRVPVTFNFVQEG